VTVIVPCRNEAGSIERCLESVVANDYPKQRLEVLVVDGMSDDGTRPLAEGFAGRYPFVRLLENPKRITPAALNVGIAAAQGDIIMRVDGHYIYPADYISRLVRWSQQSGADNVGGVLVMGPAAETAVAQAIAVAVCHPFGVGNAYYRIGSSEPRWVDTVPFGCYRREVFDRVGRFDEELVRNQDIEFNLRLRKAGGKILLVPDVVLHGHARGSLAKMARMYYQYGYYNPLVIRKLGGRITCRQTVTPLFVVALFSSAVLALWLPLMGWLLAAILIAYAVPLLVCSTKVALSRGWRCGLALCLAFPLLHISHGLGFLSGLLDFVILRRDPRRIAAQIPLTR
jgi:cellulose synthase/poly-beta-1,6-N-acetylglucosamine synthase-like glycosyltransferase